MFNSITRNYTYNLPAPVDCDCGRGKLVPILRPCKLVRYHDGYSGLVFDKPKEVVQEGFNEGIWKCSACGKVVMP